MYQLRRSRLKKAIPTALVGVLAAFGVVVTPKPVTATPVIQDLGYTTSTPKFLGETLKVYGNTNYLAKYDDHALGIVDRLGYVGFTPPLLRQHDIVLVNGKQARDSKFDAYVNNPGSNFKWYTSNLFFPSDSKAVSFGVSSIFGSAKGKSSKIQIESWETTPASGQDRLFNGSEGQTIRTGLLNSSIQPSIIPLPKSRFFLLAPQSGRLTKVVVSSDFPFAIRRLAVQRASATATSWSTNSPLASFSRSTYVAMGDSFGSGEGAGWNSSNLSTFDQAYLAGTTASGKDGDEKTPDVPFGCHRARNGWATQVWASLAANGKLNSTKPGVAGLNFVACSGARTIDFLMPSHTGYDYQPPQFTALSAETKVVTVAIGINDLGFAALLGECGHIGISDSYGTGNCEGRLTQNFNADLAFLSQTNWQADNSLCRSDAPNCNSDSLGFGRQCHQAYPAGEKPANNGSSTWPVHKFDYQICGANYQMADIYKWIARLAPNAKINIIGYPSPFTDCHQPSGDILDLAPDAWTDPRIDCNDMTWLHNIGLQIRDVLKSEVNKAAFGLLLQGALPAIRFIDTQNAGLTEFNTNFTTSSFGHGYANSTSFSTMDPFKNSDYLTRPEAFHPNAQGQNELASYIIANLFS